MGKNTGFLDYAREDNKCIPPLKRIKNYNEFHVMISEEERKLQGARCMNCGTPFCQSGMKIGGKMVGCPLHNMIPEWNDEIYHGNYKHACDRLLKMNNFPEFTGRVCPALCEKACLCGKDGEPVTCHENELAIIEHAFESGYIKPRIPLHRTDKKIAVVGSGPAGLAVADQLNRRGYKVTVFEKSDRPGGLLMYGIPNMKLDKEIVMRRIRLMKAEGVTFKLGVDVAADRKPKNLLKTYDAVVLACGAGNARDMEAEHEGIQGIYYAVDFLTDCTKGLLEKNIYKAAKGKKVIIVGSGDTANDCVASCVRQGAADVKQIVRKAQAPLTRPEGNDWPEWPNVLVTDYGQEEAIAVYGQDPRLYRRAVKKVLTNDKNEITGIETVAVEGTSGNYSYTPGSEEILECDMLIIAAGFAGCTSDVPEAFGIELTKRHTASTKGQSHETSVPGVFAAGDMRNGATLVVQAIADGRACAVEVDTYLMGYSTMGCY